MTFKLLAGLREIAPAYDGFILDLWGVLHDGSKPFPGVLDALTQLKRAGKRLAVLSNAPRRAALVASRMTEIGIPPALHDHVHSSGEEAWQHLKRRDDSFYAALGRRCYHLGPTRDENMLEGIDIEQVADVAAAEFILNTGPALGWEETVADYETLLQAARARDMPMVCANPDLVVIHEGRPAICAGALAQRYETLGGRVRWHGKPYSSVYETCFAWLGITDRRRILAVGDSLRTDIAGAAAAGIDSVLVTGGIHSEEFGVAPGELPDRARLEAALAASGHYPTAAIAHFLW
ncbi:MAG TPA: TIGR01459 family HAD-type hydrolase [Stellaceae bacterium]|nr:TIGR01459 family HAD-type hydrolase [Stellaceae bacterium]